MASIGKDLVNMVRWSRVVGAVTALEAGDVC